MLKLLGTAVAAATLAFAGSAGASTILDRFDLVQGSVNYVSNTPEKPRTCYSAAPCLNISGTRFESKSTFTIIQRPWAEQGWSTADWVGILLMVNNSGSGHDETFYIGFNIDGVDYKAYVTASAAIPWTDIFKTSYWADDATSTGRWIFGSDDPFGPNVSGVDTYFQAVPEPSTWAMMIVGFGLAGTGLRRARRLRLAS